MIQLILIWIFEWLWCLADLIIKPRNIAYKKGFERELRWKKFNRDDYDKWKKTSFRLKSDYGYILSCEVYESTQNVNISGDRKIAILCHGLGCAKYESIKYAELFIKLGFTVVVYDHRNHGMSGKAYTSMGYFEKYDLKKVVSWCKDNYGKKSKIVTHGESMGAATVLLHLEIDNRVDCVIADCSYSDLKSLIQHQLKQFYHLPGMLLPIENLIIYLRAGFWMKQISPIRAIRNSTTPVLFIHGKWDNFVPTEMSKKMYQQKLKNKAIYLVAKAKHAESYCKNKKGYEYRVREFLKKYLK